MKYFLSPTAKKDIEGIIHRVANYNSSSADRLSREFKRVFESLSLFPLLGSVKEDFTNKPYRWLHIEGYWIAYNPNTMPIKIIRVLNSYLDITKKL